MPEGRQRDDEHGGEALGGAAVHLHIDDLESLPAQELVRIRHGLATGKVRPAVARCTDAVQRLDREHRIRQHPVTDLLVHGLQLGCHLRGSDALLGVSRARPDDALGVPAARTLQPGVQNGIVLCLRGDQAIRVRGHRHAHDIASSARELELGRPRRERVGRDWHDIVQLAKARADVYQSLLRAEVIAWNGHDVEAGARAPEVLVVRVDGRREVGVVGDELALRILDRQQGHLPDGDGADGGEDEEYRGGDGLLHQLRRDHVLQEPADVAARVFRLCAAQHLVRILLPLFHGLGRVLLWHHGAAQAAPGQAETTVDAVGVDTGGVHGRKSREHSDLEEEQNEHAEGRVHAEGGECGQGGGDRDREGHEVGERCDHDRHTCVSEGIGDSLRDGLLRVGPVERIHDHERVIDADTDDDERQNAVRRSVVEPQVHREAVAGDASSHDGQSASEGQKSAGVHLVAETAKVQDQVNDHEQEGTIDEANVTSDRRAEDVAEGASGLAVDLEVLRLVAAGADILLAHRRVAPEDFEDLLLPHRAARVLIAAAVAHAVHHHEVSHGHGLGACHLATGIEGGTSEHSRQVRFGLAHRVECVKRIHVRAQLRPVVIPGLEHRVHEARVAPARLQNAQRAESVVDQLSVGILSRGVDGLDFPMQIEGGL
mmetsp:Transcript_8077/g.29364  ORF Transcript_8077/g.29364 Transcript_8077/m.29364 type:complete len:658 (+) Transcript_8077:782-2755(+)